VDYALDNNPDLIAAREASKAAGYDVKVAGASRLPTVSASASTNSTNYLNGFQPGVPNAYRNMVAGVTASIPLFQGGAPARGCARRRPPKARRWSRKSAPNGP
jgi:outer membrane protein